MMSHKVNASAGEVDKSAKCLIANSLFDVNDPVTPLILLNIFCCCGCCGCCGD